MVKLFQVCIDVEKTKIYNLKLHFSLIIIVLCNVLSQKNKYSIICWWLRISKCVGIKKSVYKIFKLLVSMNKKKIELALLEIIW